MVFNSSPFAFAFKIAARLEPEFEIGDFQAAEQSIGIDVSLPSDTGRSRRDFHRPILVTKSKFRQKKHSRSKVTIKLQGKPLQRRSHRLRGPAVQDPHPNATQNQKD